MKLNHRILLLIAPVILLSSAASNYIIYNSQKDALIKRTDSYLQLNMEKLASHFRQTKALVSSYSFTLAKSDIIRYYFSHKQNPYRELELVDNMHETLHILQPSEQKFVALSILDGNKKVLYYAENSNDPFAQIDPTVKKYVDARFEKTRRTSDVSFTTNSSGDGVLVRYDVLDTQTLETPLSYNRDEVFFVVVYVKLDQFNALRHKMEYDNKTLVYFAHTPPKHNYPLLQSVELQPGLYAIFDPAPMLLKNQLSSIQKDLLVSFSVSAFVTVLLLLILLYRHVINPILRLDSQLQEVENKQRRNIEKLNTNDEIGRLSTRFYVMYTELESTYQRTKILAENDHLTKLANRHQFQVQAQKALAELPPKHHAWVLYIDLDNFKYVNDKYGHQVGDSLLISFATHMRLLCDEFQREDGVVSIPARLSGDEFAIIICSPHRLPHSAQKFAELLLEPILNKSSTALSNLPITASVGISTYIQDGDHIDKLLIHADAAMYQAKNSGKNQISFYSRKLDKEVQRRNRIERALRSGNFDDEFTLYYQPYFSRTDGMIAGVEVLLRWHSKHLGDVSPKEFIPVAEQTGLFNLLDRWVIKTAFSQYTTLRKVLNESLQLSINLSTATLTSLELANFIDKQAHKHQISPNMVAFEITETFTADKQNYLLLTELNHLGFGLTIDDFGVHHTSLAQLLQYPVKNIKFGRHFLETLSEKNKQSVIKPLIELCHSQGMTVTAQGVENYDSHHWVSSHQCDYLQGYFYAQPMSYSGIIEWHTNKQETVNHAKGHHFITQSS
ncbi:putative bifunctional diguanylate cyclase/phosphodiesterase [Vibrio nitrifigilis]|uniref:EAL domain-containing protein n=1 Tax=Vibrio nitrifigilis TaxID=2789781 RepID=A0ABS0GA57_9VIBR|nr:EAL domain-containing protein [Vibrio nitrifigilis]MBF8999183.1 EAL domain-containing protein [Vibrio nitrifigilis]